MNKTHKAITVSLAAGLLVLGLGMAQKAMAANPDTITLSVTPGNVAYGVSITSPMAEGYVFGTVNLGATTLSTAAIAVQNSGTISEYFSLKVSNSSPDSWTPLSADGTPDHNEFELLGRFNSTQPTSATFSATDDIVDGSFEDPAAAKFGQASTKTAPSNSQNLWLKLIMPTTVSSSSQQTLTLSINGQVN